MGHIWVDGDGCPKECLEIVSRALARTGVGATVVANKWMRLPPLFQFLHVPGGLDVADDAIVARAQQGQLALTADIPLAARLVPLGLTVLDFRGQTLTLDNVEERLSIRNFMTALREGGVQTGGPRPFGPRDKQSFANALDRWLARIV